MAGRIDKLNTPDIETDYWPDCNLCKLCDNTINVCLEGEGPENADIMLVGEALGETEDELNRPFVGAAGDQLRDTLLVQAGIPESKIRITNAVRCHPPKNKKPTILEIQKCRRYLEAEIRKVKPKVIVAMGNVPLASILQFFYKGSQEEGATKKKSEPKIGGIGMWRGKIIWVQEFECWLMPTYHPSYTMRNEQMRSYYSTDLVANDLKLAWEYTKKPFPSLEKRSMASTQIIEDVLEAEKVISKMESSDAFSFDIETGGVGAATNKYIIGFSLANSDRIGYYITWNCITSNKALYKRFIRLLQSSRHYKIMHNGAYEVRILRLSHGIDINNVKYFDTMVAAQLLDENFSKRLKDIIYIHTYFGGYDVPLEKYKYENKIKEDYSKIPLPMLGHYGALDSVVTWILYTKFSKYMVREETESLFQKILMPVRRVMSDAEINGSTVDIERAHKLHSLCEKAMVKLESEIYECVGYEFNIESNPQLQKALYKTLGFDPLKRTKSGYSVDKSSIEYIATQEDSNEGISKRLLDRSYLKTMKGTHIQQAIDFRWDIDGKVHTNYNLTGAVTGRTSASAPSLQNVPRDKLVRSLYMASPGCILVDGDLKSAEMAAIAAVSGEQAFIRSFQEGMDVHVETYRVMFELPVDYVCTDDERRIAKAINFGLVYGLTPMGLAVRLGITIEQASDFIDLYFERLPNVAKWLEKQKYYVRTRGYVVSAFGRKRRLPLGLSDRIGDRSRAERQGMNGPIQSVAADYTYIGLIRMKRGIIRNEMKSKVIHTVHDCGITDTPVKEQDEMEHVMRVAFETPVKAMPIKMRVDIKRGTRWGEHNDSRLEEIFERVRLKL
jgi:DNA polymerase I